MEIPMHLDEDQIQRLLHSELPPRAGQSARDHLAECNECRDRLVEAQRDEGEIFALLRRVDHAVPAVDPEKVAARARGVGAAWGRWAAGILLFLGVAGAVYALPGSPLRDWVRSVVAWIGDSDEPPQVPAQVQAPDGGVAGIAAIPGRRFVIAFESPVPGGQAQVSLTEGEEVTVRAPIGAASFTSAADGLVITNSGSGATFKIEIPRTAPRVEIRVAGNRIFLKEGSRVLTESLAENGNRYLIPLSQGAKRLSP
jgi:hypothetical protein